MTRTPLHLAAAAIVAAALAAGCQTTPEASEPRTPQLAVQRSLVVPPGAPLAPGPRPEPGAERAMQPEWETSRNDESQGIGRQSGLSERRYIITRSNERLRTDNGRPRESSRTVTREIRRGTLYTR